MPNVILSGFADEAANQKTAVQQFSAFAAIGLQHYSLRFIDAGQGIKNVMKLTDPEIETVLNLQQEYGLKVSSVGSPIGKVKLKDVDDGTKNAYIPFEKYLAEDVRRACDLTQRFGAKLIRGFSFYHPKGTNPAEHLPQLEAYCGALWEWNTKINLTRHTDFDLFARRDLLDTVRLANHIEQGEEVLDIGTGGGVPGLVLAIIRPDLTVSVLDDLRFHTLVTRAAGSISQLIGWVKEYWLSFDRMLAIKGPRWVTERKEARQRGLLNGVELRRVDAYNMPGTKSESVILQFRRNQP